MKLPPDVNLMAVAHYLQALDAEPANKVVAILGGKSPHPERRRRRRFEFDWLSMRPRC